MFHGVARRRRPPCARRRASPRHARRSSASVAVRMDQERLIDRAETFAKTRAERLRLAFRLAGLNPAAYAGRGVGASAAR